MKAIDAMSHEEADYSSAIAQRVRSAFDKAMTQSDRSAYAASNRLGVSDIGGCREFVRRTIIDEPYSDENQSGFAPAFMGTAIGAMAEKAMTLYGGYEHIQTQVAVTVELRIGNHVLAIPGHPDLVVPDAVWDFKTVDGLGVTRREGPKERQWFQVFLYCLALIKAGMLPEDAWCVLVFVDRSGGEPEPVVFARRFDMAVVTAAEQWLGDVIYAIENNELTSRDQPRSWCEAVCPRYTACRQPDTDVEGIIEGDIYRDALKVYQQASAEEKRAKKDKESAQSVLRNVTGIIPDEGGEPYSLRWTWINPTEIAAGTRSGYYRMGLSKVRAPKAPRRKKPTDPAEMSLDEATEALAQAQAVINGGD